MVGLWMWNRHLKACKGLAGLQMSVQVQYCQYYSKFQGRKDVSEWSDAEIDDLVPIDIWMICPYLVIGATLTHPWPLTRLELQSYPNLSGPALAGSQGLSATPLLGVSPQRVGRGGLGRDRWRAWRSAGGGPGGRGTFGGAQHQGVEQVGTRLGFVGRIRKLMICSKKTMICEVDRWMIDEVDLGL